MSTAQWPLSSSKHPNWQYIGLPHLPLATRWINWKNKKMESLNYLNCPHCQQTSPFLQKKTLRTWLRVKEKVIFLLKSPVGTGLGLNNSGKSWKKFPSDDSLWFFPYKFNKICPLRFSLFDDCSINWKGIFWSFFLSVFSEKW